MGHNEDYDENFIAALIERGLNNKFLMKSKTQAIIHICTLCY